MIDVPAEVVNSNGTTAKVTVGRNQHLMFRETDSRSRSTTASRGIYA